MKGVADTLYIPLNARIFVSKKFPEYFHDDKALELEQYLPDGEIRKKSSEYSFLASAARYYNIDGMVKQFISRNGQCNVVYLGAGLETAYYRLKSSNAVFYEVDLPEVIEVRKNLLGEYKNEILIGGDLFDLRWVEQVDTSLPTLLVSSGVFMYFREQKILKFICDVQKRFDKLEMIFDATNQEGLNYANKYVKKTGNNNAMMYFYVNDAKEFASKLNRVTPIEERVFYRGTSNIESQDQTVNKNFYEGC